MPVEEAAMRPERTTIDPKRMGGLPCIRGLRIPVTTIIGLLAAGETHEQILAYYPDLEDADILAAVTMDTPAPTDRRSL